MNKNMIFGVVVIIGLFFCPISIHAADESVVDQEGQKAERPLSAVASGVRDVGAAPAQFVEHTVAQTKSGPPIVGTLRGIEQGAGDLTRSAVKGVSNIVTLGHGQQSELEPPKADTEHNDPATFKIKIPGS